jgi:Fur family transcriptional regulator, ferric uptake regulator
METEKIERILNDKAITPTAMRLLTLDFLLKQTSAVSLNDIENSFELSDRITLFRTLKTFEKKGLIHSIKDHHITRYAMCKDGCSEDHHLDAHLHFYCTFCEETTCLTNVIPRLDLPPGFKLEELNLVGRGRCNKCSDDR